MLNRLVNLAILGIVLAAIWFGVQYAEREYPHHLPWTPLVIAQPVTSVTQMKITALDGDYQGCLALFDAADVSVTPIPDRRTSDQCGYTNAVALEEMSAAYAPGTVRLSCPLAAALAIWEENSVQPAARDILGSEVAGIRHFGTFNCRRIAGSNRWSRHARAEAIDIAGFTLADGREISLISDWDGAPEQAAFLRRIRDEGCDIFGTLLGPDYNAAHRDHFHMQATGFGTCR